jgi:hypothetical protein
MNVKIKKVYYKRSQRGRDPIKFEAVQPNGIGTDVHAKIKIDPILRRHKDLRKAMLGHEVYEIKDWGRGCDNAHSHAKHREPKLTKNIGGVSGFWKEIKRRESVR